MDFKRLTSRAKDLVEKRGGTDALKQDAEELKRIAKGQGNLTDKAKAAAAALKEPGGGAEPRTPAQAMDSPQPPETSAPPPRSQPERDPKPIDREARKARRERRGVRPQG
ncbi:MAG TPA: hypothetical protein VFK32_10270 [Tepidiformaceae bacterium]|nr:hypothetical protein [Tepidiformaceae bacterium]